MLIGAAPFGVIFGTLAIAAGLSPLSTQAMSLLVFAGSSQFIAVSLVAAGAALPVIWLTTFVVNLRHALYSATLLPYARPWPLAWRWPLAFWLTDETFAVVEHRFRTGRRRRVVLAGLFAGDVRQLAGVDAGRRAAGTLGAGAGATGPGFRHGGHFRRHRRAAIEKRPTLAAAAVAGLTALLARGLPKLDLMLAALLGVGAGLLLEGKRKEAA